MTTKKIHIFQDLYFHHLNELESHLNKEVLTQYSSQEILIIFDLDGTLTTKPTPDGKTAIPRDNSTEIVCKLHDQGIHLMISSAWYDFKSTLRRIKDLNLLEKFSIPSHFENMNFSIQNKSLQAKEKSIPLTYYHLGNVVSVMDPEVDDTYFRQKAVASSIAFSDLLDKKIKKIIFVDDSKMNINIFKKDVERFKLYPHIKIDFIQLNI